MKQTLRSRGELCPKTKLSTKILYTIYITFTIVLVSCVCTRAQVSASSQEAGPAAEAVSEIKPLKIGDSIPEALWNMPLKMVKAGQEGISTVTLNDYKDKLIILDFWATWCGSCFTGLTKLNKWQNDFRQDVLIMPVSYQDSGDIRKVLISKEWTLPSIVSDEILTSYFPHKSLPHQVIISDMEVLTITSGSELEKNHISSMVDGNKVKFRVKNDILDFNKGTYLLVNQDPRISESLRYSSSFFKHIDGLGSYLGFLSSDLHDRLYITNKRIIDFYFIAVDPSMHNRIFFEVEDTSKIAYDEAKVSIDKEQWEINNTYCYELVSPANTPKSEFYRLALNDFDRNFNFNSVMENREMDCYVIKNKKGEYFIDPFKGKKPLEDQMFLPFEKLIQYLNSQFPDQDRRPVFINESNVDVTIPILITKNHYKKVDELQLLLSEYGLEVVKAKRNLEVFVISDKP